MLKSKILPCNGSMKALICDSSRQSHLNFHCIFLNDNSVTRKCYNCSFQSFFLESMSDLVLYLAILTLVFFIKWNCVRIFMKKYQGRSITWFLHEVK